MSDKTGIEWTDATWNPVTGCAKVSSGCDHCYAETFAERFRGTEGHYFERGFDVQLRREKLDQPLRWRRPRRIFVNSMSDLFHDQVPDDYIARVFGVMNDAKQHTFQILTKRHARMRALLDSLEFRHRVHHYSCEPFDRDGYAWWPLSNVWLGVSAENQQWADIRIPALLNTPAAVRFVSAEPLLGPIDLGMNECDHHRQRHIDVGCWLGLDWVIVGGESGHGARPMHPDWARSLRVQCQWGGVAFLFKQWGEYRPAQPGVDTWDQVTTFPVLQDVPMVDGAEGEWAHMRRVGEGGRSKLDGRTWDQYPEVAGG